MSHATTKAPHRPAICCSCARMLASSVARVLASMMMYSHSPSNSPTRSQHPEAREHPIRAYMSSVSASMTRANNVTRAALADIDVTEARSQHGQERGHQGDGPHRSSAWVECNGNRCHNFSGFRRPPGLRRGAPHYAAPLVDYCSHHRR